MEAAARHRRALGERGVAIAIVGGALIRIHQDVVGFAEFLEFLFGAGVVRVFVRMKFDRELAIRAFDLLFGRLAADDEDLVIIALGSLRHLRIGIKVEWNDLLSGPNFVAGRWKRRRSDGRSSRSLNR